MRILPTIAALALGFSAPVWAKTSTGGAATHVPPGNPCAKGNGNPCNGNNGNAGQQGNAGNKGKDDGVVIGAPGPIDIPVPPVSGRGAYVTQIGEENRAAVTQTGANALAITFQHGSENQVGVTQEGARADFAKVVQAGERNVAGVLQGGSGQNVLYLGQVGADNRATATQLSTGGFNGAVMAQAGTGNEMELTQAGGDNKAVLGQAGDGNRMTATQEGAGNRLVWTQTGDHLSDLKIVQSAGYGNQALAITQTAPGK